MLDKKLGNIIIVALVVILIFLCIVAVRKGQTHRRVELCVLEDSKTAQEGTPVYFFEDFAMSNQIFWKKVDKEGKVLVRFSSTIKRYIVVGDTGRYDYSERVWRSISKPCDTLVLKFRKSTLTVRSIPAKAQVLDLATRQISGYTPYSLSGRGATPYQFYLHKQDYKDTLISGTLRRDTTISIMLLRNDTITVQLTATTFDSRAIVTIVGKPTGAKVKDKKSGKPWGTIPLRNKRVQVGRYSLLIEKEDYYPDSVDLVIRPGEKKKVNVTLISEEDKKIQEAVIIAVKQKKESDSLVTMCEKKNYLGVIAYCKNDTSKQTQDRRNGIIGLAYLNEAYLRQENSDSLKVKEYRDLAFVYLGQRSENMKTADSGVLFGLGLIFLSKGRLNDANSVISILENRDERGKRYAEILKNKKSKGEIKKK
ncbi:MAG: hypothetical protein AB1393_03000 [Candidatus Edwardsbacteria bacterium]